MHFVKYLPLVLGVAVASAAWSQPAEQPPSLAPEADLRQSLEPSDCSQLHSYECVVDAVWTETIAWLNAWAEHDLETYFSAYAANQSPIADLSYRAWRKQRERRVSDPKTIKLGVNFLNAEIVPQRKVRVLFIQRYSAGDYSDIVLKTLVYQYIDQKFRITEEISHQTLTEADAQTIIDNIQQ